MGEIYCMFKGNIINIYYTYKESIIIILPTYYMNELSVEKTESSKGDSLFWERGIRFYPSIYGSTSGGVVEGVGAPT